MLRSGRSAVGILNHTRVTATSEDTSAEVFNTSAKVFNTSAKVLNTSAKVFLA